MISPRCSVPLVSLRTTPRRLATVLLGMTLIAASAWSPVAHAGEAEKAEHLQLYEEMRKYAARNAWAGVESNYKRLLILAEKGEVLTYEDHRLGAEAARALGNMGACRERLINAGKVKPSDEVKGFLADIDASFGEVDIRFGRTAKEGAAAVPVMPPFAPEQRQAITFANTRLSAREPFEGLLPAGDYAIGETTFAVVAGKAVEVTVGEAAVASGGGDFKASGGVRVAIGASLTSAGAADSGPVAGGFGGPGIRAGVGYELAVSPVLGVLGQVGYHGFTGSAGTDGEEVNFEQFSGTAPTQNQLRLGYAWLAGTARFSGLKVGVGPLMGVGSAQVTPSSPGPGAYSVVPLTASVTLFGVGGSVDYGLVKFGSYQLALGVEGGAMLDAERMWPWGELALTLEPSFAGGK